MQQVSILLAAYNGSKYLREMIDSVLAQDFQDFRLVLSDDQSSDGTADILEEYAQKYPQTVTHYRSGQRFGNAQKHFMHLLQEFHDSSYIMFCDQDDYWHPDKISRTLEKIKQIETPDVPAMVHTDLRVVNGSLEAVDESFMHYSRLKGDRLALNQLLVQNVVTGCTMMVNRALAQLAVTNIPEEGMLMHDWWLALIASAVGTAGFLDEATIDYRQHGSNVVGANNVRSLRYIVKKLRNNTAKEMMRKTYVQAGIFEKCFAGVLEKDKLTVVRKASSMLTSNGFSRRIKFLRYKLLKNGLTRIVGQMIWG